MPLPFQLSIVLLSFSNEYLLKMSKMITQKVLNGICFNETREITILAFICKFLSEILMLRLKSE